MSDFEIFADALWQFYEVGYADLQTEREDKTIRPENVAWYFTTYRDFQPIEKSALKFARGRVLDAGCGAGRHALYLQARGLRVTAIDLSPRIIDLTRLRGVRDARVADVCKLPFREHEFDTVILFGNNLGMSGTPKKFTRMLRELRRVTSSRGRILATTRMPSATNPVHRRYFTQLIASGRPVGQMRLRQWLNGRRGEWFDWLLLAPTDLMQLGAQAGWQIAEIFCDGNFEDGYSVVLEKM